MTDFLGTPIWMWAAFLGIVVALLALDLGVLHRKQREIGVATVVGYSLWATRAKPAPLSPVS